MTPHVRALVAVAVVAFAVFIVVNAPAVLVADRVADADPALTLNGISGTAWRGHAEQVRYGPIAVGTLDWSVAGAQLFVLRGAAHFALAGPNTRLSLDVQRAPLTGRTHIVGAAGVLPLALLAEMSGARGPLDATVELERVSLTMRGTEVERAAGRVRLRDTTALAPQRYPLGTYVLDLDAADGWLVATIADADGPLVVAGSVRVHGDGRWEMDARARASQPDSELATVLQLLGEPDADGFRPLVLSGNF